MKIRRMRKENDDREAAKLVRREYERRKTERMPWELKWTLNANFFMGNQYCDINPYKGMGIEQFEPSQKNVEREVFNRIAPIIETRCANLQKITYAMVVKPRRDDIDDMAKADVSTKILRHYQDVSHFDSMKDKAILWNELTGSAFWVTGWNKHSGRVTAKKVREEICDGEVTRRIEDVHEGDIEYSLLSPYEVYPEDCMCEGVENQHSLMIVQVMNTDEAYERYGVEAEGKEIQCFTVTPKPVSYGYEKECVGSALNLSTRKNAVRIITYYEKPGKTYPKGRCIIMADEGEGKIVHNGELPYGFMPVVQIKCKNVPGQFFGKSTIEELIPLQRAYNDVKNRIHEHIKRIAIGGYWVEEGSVDTDLMAEGGLPPGGILEYERGSNKPTPISTANLPNEVLKEAEYLRSEMEYVAGVSQLQMVGGAPGGITSGSAIESLREIDNTRMAMTGAYLRDGVVKLGVMWLKLYKQYALLPRITDYTGLNGIGNAIVWQREDITSYEVDFETENELVVSEEMQKQNFIDAMNMGLFTDETGVMSGRVKNLIITKMKLGAYSDIMDINQLSISAAQRENTYMRSGAFCDINEYDDDDIHAQEHRRFILSTEYEILRARKPAWAKLVLNHLKAHEIRLEEMQKAIKMQNA